MQVEIAIQSIVMKNILFILDYYLPHQWWAEKLFSQLINRLLEEWNTVTVLTTKHKKTLPTKETTWNLTIIRKWSTRGSLLFWWVIMWLQYCKNKDLIHTTSYAWAFPAWIISKLYKIPVVITIHELFWDMRKDISPSRWWIYQLYEKLMVSLSYTSIVTVSQYTKDCLSQRYNINENVTIIYNWIDALFYKQHTHTINKVAIKAFYFWHCWYSKWIDTYVNALPVIYNNFPQTTFIFNLLPSNNTTFIKEKLKYLAKTIPIKIYNWVTQEELITLIQESSFVVVPSRSEWFWLAAWEVCALWVPLITTNNWSLPEVVSWKYVLLDWESSKDYINARNNILRQNKSANSIKNFNREECHKQYSKIRNKSIIQ